MKARRRNRPACAAGALCLSCAGKAFAPAAICSWPSTTIIFADLDELVTYLVQKTRPGDEVKLLLIRDKQTVEIKLTLQTHPVAGNQRVLDCSASE